MTDFMQVAKTISSTLTGTSVMTGFSYLVSSINHKQFREPELLHILLQRMLENNPDEKLKIDGWMIHYTVGTAFNMVYDLIWRKSKIKPSVFSGAVLGLISGFIGREVWRLTLKTHPEPPAIDRQAFYNHLIVAHILFGIFSAAGYSAAPSKLNRK